MWIGVFDNKAFGEQLLIKDCLSPLIGPKLWQHRWLCHPFLSLYLLFITHLYSHSAFNAATFKSATIWLRSHCH